MKDIISIYLLGLSLIIIGCNPCNAGPNNYYEGDSTAKIGNYSLVLAFPNMKFNDPVELVSPSDNTDRIFLVEQKGKIKVFPNKPGVEKDETFLDIVSKVESGGEKGLLGLAFDPDYKSNGYFYLNYTRGDPLETVIVRYKASASNPNLADPGSETVILRFGQPFSNHNGGKLAFGNDGFLYIAVGDGGAGGDPGNRAQNKKELLGKILRIDVKNTSATQPYAIPSDNPFAGNKDGFKEEIYSYGMRNPWRFSFDKTTGMLWAGDVGQNKIEEVDIIEKGGNYGWRVMEANECYNSDTCNKSGLVEPIWTYPHGVQGYSITGGYVCRDKSLPELNGKYIYGDYATGRIWALTYEGKKAVKNELVTKIGDTLSSFGEDSKSNLYLLGYVRGQVYKIVNH